jgi:hypothetical protein
VKIDAITLEDFRGIHGRRRTELNPSGVTIVEGPNEVGKTSLLYGLDLLFNELDSSRKQTVKSVQPEGFDVGPSAEVELTTGPYQLVLSKRWLRSPMTTLRIISPSPETLTGREAHDRFRSILEETLDLGLWSAVRYQQGVAIDQPQLGAIDSLGRALDAAAGTSPGPVAGAEQHLAGAVEAERLRYVTPTGRITRERSELRDEKGRCASRIEELEGEVRQLDHLVENLRSTTARIDDLETSLDSQRDVVADLEGRVRAFRSHAQEVSLLVARADGARERRAASNLTVAERERLVRSVEIAETALQEATDAVTNEAPDLASALEAERTCRFQRESSEVNVGTARATADKTAGDVEHFRRLTRLTYLRSRRANVEAALRSRAAAVAAIEASAVTPEALERLRGLERDTVEARGALLAESPAVHVTGLSDTAFAADGTTYQVAEGEMLEVPSSPELELTFPGVVTVRLVSGRAAADRESALRDAQGTVDRLLEELGLTKEHGLVGAERALEDRRHAEQARDLADEQLRSNLDGATVEEMDEEIERYEASTQRHLEDSQESGGVPTTRETADEAHQAARERLAEAEEAVRSASSEFDAASSALTAARLANVRLEERLATATEESRRATEQFVASRAERSDESLQDEHAAAVAESMAQDEALETAKLALSAEDLSSAEELLSNASDVLARQQTDMDNLRQKQTEIRSTLTAKGDSGLQGQLDDERTHFDELEVEFRRIERQAAAAILLSKVFESRRSAARARYATPLSEQIERLGRIVYGPTFTVVLDTESLRITHRTLEGETLPYESLSTGAREQLAVLNRLACAQLVNRSEDASSRSAPVVIDDALGNSDPERRQSLGAVLGVVGRDAQVLILTCDPSRYEHVGSATIVRLERTPAT